MACRAIAGTRHSLGKTAGQALDALEDMLPSEESGTLIVVQCQRPDRFFPAPQRERLQALMARWRTARDAGTALSPEEQKELQALTEMELDASTARTAALLKKAGA
jgi:hypothetical protein